MAKLIWRLPSKAVTYGYVEVHAAPEELGLELTEPEAMGMVYATYVGAFLKGEKDGLDLFMRGAEEEPAESHTEPPPGDSEAAAKRLEEGKKPRTVDEATEMATQVIQKELGATVVGEEPPPWSKPQAEAESKPWEKKATPKVAADVANTDW